jgi:hypothetical protein
MGKGLEMEVGNMNRAEGSSKGLPSSGFSAKRPRERASLTDWPRSLLKAFCVPVAVLAGSGLGNFAAFGDTAQSFSYDFAKTGKISFDGASSGALINSTGASNLVSSGVGTNSFQWGSGVGSPPSSLSFTGKSLDGAFPEQPFSIGTLSYFNGQVLASTEAYSVGLRTTLNFSEIARNFDYGFQLINTPNTANALQSADSVFLSSSIPTTRFAVDGVDYSLKLAFGSVTGSGFSEVNQFFVLEGGSASAELIGSITANIPAVTTPPSVPPGGSVPTVVPEPSTVLGGISAGGLILAFLVRRIRRGGSSAVLA